MTALATEHHLGMREAGVRQPKVVQKVRERLPGDAHPEATPVGKVRQPERAWRVGLAEHQLALRTVQRTPLAHAPLQGTAYTATEVAMPTHQFVEDRHHTQVRCLLEHRYDLLLEDTLKRIRSAPTALVLPHGGQPRIVLNPDLAADACGSWRCRRCMSSLIWWSVTCRPGIGSRPCKDGPP